MVKYQSQYTQDAQQPIFKTVAPYGATKTLLLHQGRIDIPLLFNKVMDISCKIFSFIEGQNSITALFTNKFSFDKLMSPLLDI